MVIKKMRLIEQALFPFNHIKYYKFRKATSK